METIYILQDFGGEDASYLSKEDFEELQSGEEEGSLEVGFLSLGLIFATWYCHVMVK